MKEDNKPPKSIPAKAYGPDKIVFWLDAVGYALYFFLNFSFDWIPELFRV